MFSTFSNETNASGDTLILKCPKKRFISAPIAIPKKSFDKENGEYELNLNFFNPDKMSPPDCWKIRLEQRIKNFYDSSISEKE